MHLITETSELAAACARLAQQPFITVDTEFMRESTFWPILCLIQIASDTDEIIIDPLAADLDLAPFFELMAAQDVLKVFHAGRQDIEIVYNMSRVIPYPIFDTQIAAMVCGFGDSVGYVMLVKKLLREDVDKSSRFTDWSRRPLSKRQLNYALGDVTYLIDIYRQLDQQVTEANRSSWLSEELSVLVDPRTYDLHPEDAWKRLKMRVKNPRSLAIMMEVAAWRERTAQSQNVPRNRIIKDDAIYDIANQSPGSVAELSKLRTISEGLARSSRGKDILAAVQRGLGTDADSLPAISKSRALPPDAAAVIDLLRVLLKSAAAHHGVAPKLIASMADLEKIAVDDEADVAALKGWRHDLFGSDAIALKHGKLALMAQNGRIVRLNPASEQPEREDANSESNGSKVAQTAD
ncbi:ribonuclease D [bacterium MnTg02]|nr:ribonuclease D [bacterium MnTg02]